jgi:hypothetical protein
MKKLSILLTIIFLTHIFISHSFANSQKKNEPLTLSQLMTGIADYEKKEISLVGTIVGACGSGCKVWLSEGEYKDGKPVALVWAKDKAFTFKTDATGNRVKLKGYAVAKYINLCSLEKRQQAVKEHKTAATKGKKDCESPLEAKQKNRHLKSITFFATSIDYLK